MKDSGKLLGTAAVMQAALMLSLAGISVLQSAVPKRVLVMHWYDRNYPGNPMFDKQYQAALQSAASGAIEFYSEYLESNKFPGEDQSQLLSDYLQQKYAGRTVDVIVSAGVSPVLDFLLKHRSTLFPQTPIVFVTERPLAAHALANANATGIITANSYVRTLDLALKLHPETERLYVISGTLTHDKAWESIIRNDLKPYKEKLNITYLTDLTLEELIVRLKNLPKKSIVLYAWQQLLGHRGEVVESQQILSAIAHEVSVPMYGMSAVNVGLGIVGGQVWTFEGVTAKLAELTLRVANGERTQDIPIAKGPDIPMFDWRQLQRWKIDEGRLPPGSVIRFRELTAWQQYRWRIVAAVGAFGLQTILIGALLWERRRARRVAAALIKAQRVLEESEERFRNMADTAPVMIWVAGPNKLCTFFNTGWLSFTGHTLQQELAVDWPSYIHPDDFESCAATYHAAFDARMPFQMEYRLRRADGEYRSLLCSGVPRFQVDGVFAGYIGSCLDITDVKRTQEKALAGQKLESMGQLASGIAHDFNNLLGGILAWTELALAAHSEHEPHEEELVRIKDSAIRGAEIVRELMIYGGRHSLNFEPVDCSLLIHEMLQLLKVSISKYAVLRTELAESCPMVQANSAQIRQLIMNLVINASDAIGEQEGEIRVTTKMLTADQSAPMVAAANLPKGDYLQLEVADTGSGMAEEERTRIFDPFFTTKPSGRGLGLAVVQGVVRAHGGLIKVVSSPGCGATFQVLLPCILKENLKTQTMIDRQAMDEYLSGNGTVLIIEDENTLRIAVSKMLQKRGFTVLEAEDGNSGVDLFLAHAPEIDIVLLDMTLPGKSGRDVLAELQRRRPDVKVIITSAYGQNKVRSSLAGLEPSAYVQKPYQLAQLVNLLRECSAEPSVSDIAG